MHRFGQVNLRMDQPSATFNSSILTMTKCGYIAGGLNTTDSFICILRRIVLIVIVKGKLMTFNKQEITPDVQRQIQYFC